MSKSSLAALGEQVAAGWWALSDSAHHPDVS
ncbi:hypothetical protein GA0074692_0847 [Micromonospora pallida]|uniref:Uncharacterized protein n=1 Tax=Micromonospora pallida TaxID=145854 RepID=A0A1C6RT16_9ACTN|nr:hypothetical protein GA0074692_0847 [Micromonospora pallida]